MESLLYCDNSQSSDCNDVDMDEGSESENEQKIDPMFSTDCGPNATYRNCICLFQTNKHLRVKEKRELFKCMRIGGDTVNENTFLPKYGITVGEFSIFYILTENNRKTA